MLQTDVLVIGSGMAGCVTALSLAERGLRVIMITKAAEPEESNTYYAQGGIVYENNKVDPEVLIKDILKAGDGICRKEAVEILAEEGPKLIEKFLIEKIAVKFSVKNDKLHLTKEAAHSFSRILHVNDQTGEALEKALLRAVKKSHLIRVISECSLVDLLTLPHHSINPLDIYKEPVCIGAYVLHNGKVERILAKKTVLATGGIGQIFWRTVNSKVARGDGLAAAARAGTEVLNLEYVQFHPTSFYHRDLDNFLISEAVRGEGARLKDKKGRLFMRKYHPEGSLAPRDVVCRAIYNEMVQSGENYVFLDAASYLPVAKIKSQFSHIYKTCLKYGVDITKEPIPVAPTAHFHCGGVRTDLWGRSTLKNLYAVGEVACTGVHGANRLASTSLLECLVFGVRAPRDISESLESCHPDPAFAGEGSPGDSSARQLAGLRMTERSLVLPQRVKEWQPVDGPEPDPALITQDWMLIKSIMWNYVGIVRTEEGLKRAVADLSYWQHRVEQFYRETRVTDSLLGLRNGLQVALLVAQAALRNKQSRGCHYRKMV